MIRTLGFIGAVFCVATVLSVAIGLTFFWYRGQLTAETVRELQLVLAGDVPESLDPAAETEPQRPSTQEVLQARLEQDVLLNSRQRELTALKSMVDGRARVIARQQEELQLQQDRFRRELEELDAQVTDEATTQARGILAAMQPAEAVGNLMPLSLEQNVQLLSGLPDKTVARILQQFEKGQPDQRVRGQKIFEAISEGQPRRGVVDSAQDALPAAAANPANNAPARR